MKTGRLLFLLFVSIAFLSSCSKLDSDITNPEEQDAYLSVIVGGYFKSDFVKVSLNNSVLVEDTMSTGQVIGAAWSSGLKKIKGGSNTLNAEIKNFNMYTNKVFVLKDTMTAVISYNRTSDGQFRIDIYKGLLLLD